ncbi:MAG: ribosome maturation factor RimP [Leptospiraceae bacterium]|nr:ribosome maturation factor RimP [Leptospiraceae bacterium]
MAISEDQIKDILKEVLVYPLALFSLKIKKSTLSSVILEVVLDQMVHPTGSASLQDCEMVSRVLSEKLDALDPDGNFQLKVQSAGAERKLRLPEDLVRFQGLLAQLEVVADGGKTTQSVYKILEVKDDKIRLEPFHGNGKKKKSSIIVVTELQKVKKGNLYIHI